MTLRTIGCFVLLFTATSALAADLGLDAASAQQAVVGQLFKLQLTAHGGTAHYSFALASGQLPNDVGLSQDGLITGTPTVTGTFECTIAFADGNGAVGQVPITFTVKLPPDPQPLAEDTADAKWHKPGWAMTFHDEFDNPPVDQSKWSGRYSVIPSLCAIQDGIAHLRFEKNFPPGLNPKSRISGLESRRTTNAFAQQYGWFELRARCHKGPGGQCAFWLAPVDGRYMRLKLDGGTRGSPFEANEIDIFEQQGNEPNGNNFTVHFGEPEFDGSIARHVIFPFDYSADFHVYALEWDAWWVIWYVDGKEVHRTDKTPKNPFFIRLGIYEGDSDWSGKLDPKDPYPKDFDLDYMRVYRKVSEAK